jgi:hypothetical protein
VDRRQTARLNLVVSASIVIRHQSSQYSKGMISSVQSSEMSHHNNEKANLEITTSEAKSDRITRI